MAENYADQIAAITNCANSWEARAICDRDQLFMDTANALRAAVLIIKSLQPEASQ